MARSLSPADQQRLIALLADGQLHAGEQLAAEFGISRAALSKRVEQLRDWGVQTHAVPGRGYQLAHALDLLNPQAIAEAGGAALQGVRIELGGWLDSTNSRLLESKADHDPQALFAEGQSAGRGRRGRHWISPYASNLCFSLAWRFEAMPPQLTALPLAVAVILARWLRLQGLNAGIKWPNDIQIDGRKLCGILIEHRGEAAGAFRAVIGVGVNIRMTDDNAAQIDQPWTGLAEHLPMLPARSRVAGELLSALVAGMRSFELQGFEPFAFDYRSWDVLMGRPVRILEADRECHAEALGVDSAGALQVRDEFGIRALYSGDVSVRTHPESAS